MCEVRIYRGRRGPSKGNRVRLTIQDGTVVLAEYIFHGYPPHHFSAPLGDVWAQSPATWERIK